VCWYVLASGGLSSLRSQGEVGATKLTAIQVLASTTPATPGFLVSATARTCCRESIRAPWRPWA